MEPLDALSAAHREFEARLVLLEPSHWAEPTPCHDWDVHYLVAHVIGGNRFAICVLGGESASSAIEHVMSHPQIGDDALADFGAASGAQLAAFEAALRDGRPVDHVRGPITPMRFLGLRTFDIAVHAWDLAVALDADRRLHTELVHHVLGVLDAEPDIGFDIQPLGRAEVGADPQTILLDRSGRHSR